MLRISSRQQCVFLARFKFFVPKVFLENVLARTWGFLDKSVPKPKFGNEQNERNSCLTRFLLNDISLALFITTIMHFYGSRFQNYFAIIRKTDLCSSSSLCTPFSVLRETGFYQAEFFC